VPRDYVKALLNHRDDDVTAIYARWHMFDEKREAMMAIETRCYRGCRRRWLWRPEISESKLPGFADSAERALTVRSLYRGSLGRKCGGTGAVPGAAVARRSRRRNARRLFL